MPSRCRGAKPLRAFKRFRIAGESWVVERVKGLRGSTDKPADATYDYGLHLIRVEATLLPTAADEAVFHELRHVAGIVVADEEREQSMSRRNTALFAILRDNKVTFAE